MLDFRYFGKFNKNNLILIQKIQNDIFVGILRYLFCEKYKNGYSQILCVHGVLCTV